MKLFLLKVLKIFAICLASVIGGVGIVVGVVAIQTNGFQPAKITTTGLAFSQSEYYFSPTFDEDGQEVIVEDALVGAQVDYDKQYIGEILIEPTPVNASFKEVKLRVIKGNYQNIKFIVDEDTTIVLSSTNTITFNIGDRIKVVPTRNLDGTIIGGDFEILATLVSNPNIANTTKIFFDVPVQNFTLTSDLQEDETIFIGREFNVSITNVTPTNSVTGFNYTESGTISGITSLGTKNVYYESNNSSIATVDENGVVTVLQDGNFTITARIFKTYALQSNHKSYDDFVNDETIPVEDVDTEYNKYMDSISIRKYINYTASDIAVDSITAQTTSVELNLFEQTTVNLFDLGIRLHPQDGSGYDYTDLTNAIRLGSVVVYGGTYTTNGTIVTGYSIDNQNESTVSVSRGSVALSFNVTATKFEAENVLNCLVIGKGTYGFVEGTQIISGQQNPDDELFDINSTGHEIYCVIPVSINQVGIESLTVTGNVEDNTEIYLTEGEEYSLSDNYVLTGINGATPSYRTVKFFVTESTASTIANQFHNTALTPNYVYINSVKCIEVYSNNLGEYYIQAIANGQPSIYAVVVKTDMNGNPIYITGGTPDTNQIVSNSEYDYVYCNTTPMFVTITQSFNEENLSASYNISGETVLENNGQIRQKLGDDIIVEFAYNPHEVLFEAFNYERFTVTSEYGDVASVSMGWNSTLNVLEVEFTSNTTGRSVITVKYDMLTIMQFDIVITDVEVMNVYLDNNDTDENSTQIFGESVNTSVQSEAVVVAIVSNTPDNNYKLRDGSAFEFLMKYSSKDADEETVEYFNFNEGTHPNLTATLLVSDSINGTYSTANHLAKIEYDIDNDNALKITFLEGGIAYFKIQVVISETNIKTSNIVKVHLINPDNQTAILNGGYEYTKDYDFRTTLDGVNPQNEFTVYADNSFDGTDSTRTDVRITDDVKAYIPNDAHTGDREISNIFEFKINSITYDDVNISSAQLATFISSYSLSIEQVLDTDTNTTYSTLFVTPVNKTMRINIVGKTFFGREINFTYIVEPNIEITDTQSNSSASPYVLTTSSLLNIADISMTGDDRNAILNNLIQLRTHDEATSGIGNQYLHSLVTLLTTYSRFDNPTFVDTNDVSLGLINQELKVVSSITSDGTIDLSNGLPFSVTISVDLENQREVAEGQTKTNWTYQYYFIIYPEYVYQGVSNNDYSYRSDLYPNGFNNIYSGQSYDLKADYMTAKQINLVYYGETTYNEVVTDEENKPVYTDLATANDYVFKFRMGSNSDLPYAPFINRSRNLAKSESSEVYDLVTYVDGTGNHVELAKVSLSGLLTLSNNSYETDSNFVFFVVCEAYSQAVVGEETVETKQATFYIYFNTIPLDILIIDQDSNFEYTFDDGDELTVDETHSYYPTLANSEVNLLRDCVEVYEITQDGEKLNTDFKPVFTIDSVRASNGTQYTLSADKLSTENGYISLSDYTEGELLNKKLTVSSSVSEDMFITINATIGGLEKQFYVVARPFSVSYTGGIDTTTVIGNFINVDVKSKITSAQIGSVEPTAILNDLTFAFENASDYNNFSINTYTGVINCTNEIDEQITLHIKVCYGEFYKIYNVIVQPIEFVVSDSISPVVDVLKDIEIENEDVVIANTITAKYKGDIENTPVSLSYSLAYEVANVTSQSLSLSLDKTQILSGETVMVSISSDGTLTINDELRTKLLLSIEGRYNNDFLKVSVNVIPNIIISTVAISKIDDRNALIASEISSGTPDLDDYIFVTDAMGNLLGTPTIGYKLSSFGGNVFTTPIDESTEELPTIGGYTIEKVGSPATKLIFKIGEDTVFEFSSDGYILTNNYIQNRITFDVKASITTTGGVTISENFAAVIIPVVEATFDESITSFTYDNTLSLPTIDVSTCLEQMIKYTRSGLTLNEPTVLSDLVFTIKSIDGSTSSTVGILNSASGIFTFSEFVNSQLPFEVYVTSTSNPSYVFEFSFIAYPKYIFSENTKTVANFEQTNVIVSDADYAFDDYVLVSEKDTSGTGYGQAQVLSDTTIVISNATYFVDTVNTEISTITVNGKQRIKIKPNFSSSTDFTLIDSYLKVGELEVLNIQFNVVAKYKIVVVKDQVTNTVYIPNGVTKTLKINEIAVYQVQYSMGNLAADGDLLKYSVNDIATDSLTFAITQSGVTINTVDSQTQYTYGGVTLIGETLNNTENSDTSIASVAKYIFTAGVELQKTFTIQEQPVTFDMDNLASSYANGTSLALYGGSTGLIRVKDSSESYLTATEIADSINIVFTDEITLPSGYQFSLNKDKILKTADNSIVVSINQGYLIVSNTLSAIIEVKMQINIGDCYYKVLGENVSIKFFPAQIHFTYDNMYVLEDGTNCEQYLKNSLAQDVENTRSLDVSSLSSAYNSTDNSLTTPLTYSLYRVQVLGQTNSEDIINSSALNGAISLTSGKYLKVYNTITNDYLITIQVRFNDTYGYLVVLSKGSMILNVNRAYLHVASGEEDTTRYINERVVSKGLGANTQTLPMTDFFTVIADKTIVANSVRVNGAITPLYNDNSDEILTIVDDQLVINFANIFYEVYFTLSIEVDGITYSTFVRMLPAIRYNTSYEGVKTIDLPATNSYAHQIVLEKYEGGLGIVSAVTFTENSNDIKSSLISYVAQDYLGTTFTVTVTGIYKFYYDYSNGYWTRLGEEINNRALAEVLDDLSEDERTYYNNIKSVIPTLFSENEGISVDLSTFNFGYNEIIVKIELDNGIEFYIAIEPVLLIDVVSQLASVVKENETGEDFGTPKEMVALTSGSQYSIGNYFYIHTPYILGSNFQITTDETGEKQLSYTTRAQSAVYTLDSIYTFNGSSVVLNNNSVLASYITLSDRAITISSLLNTTAYLKILVSYTFNGIAYSDYIYIKVVPNVQFALDETAINQIGNEVTSDTDFVLDMVSAVEGRLNYDLQLTAKFLKYDGEAIAYGEGSVLPMYETQATITYSISEITMRGITHRSTDNDFAQFVLGEEILLSEQGIFSVPSDFSQVGSVVIRAQVISENTYEILLSFDILQTVMFTADYGDSGEYGELEGIQYLIVLRPTSTQTIFSATNTPDKLIGIITTDGVVVNSTVATFEKIQLGSNPGVDIPVGNAASYALSIAGDKLVLGEYDSEEMYVTVKITVNATFDGTTKNYIGYYNYKIL